MKKLKILERKDFCICNKISNTPFFTSFFKLIIDLIVLLLSIIINRTPFIFFTRGYSVLPIIHVISDLGKLCWIVFMIGIICVISPIEDNLKIQIEGDKLLF